MNLVTSCLSKVSIAGASVIEHVKKHSKTYLIGVAILAAVGMALYVNANIQETFMIRYSGGRRITSDDLAAPVFREHDPTSPIFRRLKALIGGARDTPKASFI